MVEKCKSSVEHRCKKLREFLASRDSQGLETPPSQTVCNGRTRNLMRIRIPSPQTIRVRIPNIGTGASPGTAKVHGSTSNSDNRGETKEKGIRRRPELKKNPFVVEMRPPMFKWKMWLGSYKRLKEARRARDAYTFYTQCEDLDYLVEDSPDIFGALSPIRPSFKDLNRNVPDHEFEKEIKRRVKEARKHDKEKAKLTQQNGNANANGSSSNEFPVQHGKPNSDDVSMVDSDWPDNLVLFSPISSDEETDLALFEMHTLLQKQITQDAWGSMHDMLPLQKQAAAIGEHTCSIAGFSINLGMETDMPGSSEPRGISGTFDNASRCDRYG